eukprot:g688.t1
MSASLRHDPLGATLVEKEGPRIRNRQPKKQKKVAEDSEFLSEKMSRKVLEQARAQQMDIEEERRGGGGSSKRAAKMTAATAYEEERGEYSDDGEIDEDGVKLEDEYVVADEEMTEADMRAMRMFMGGDDDEEGGMMGGRRTLADIILDKIKEKEERIKAAEMGDSEEMGPPPLDPKVVSVYKRVGQLLAKYRSGKLPKAFKIIPALSRWEDILLLTAPDKWSAQATWNATRVFASNFNVKSAQRFFNLILLPRVRDDIAANNKLNFHLYVSLKKALYKSSAFYKGILIPLCEDRPSLKEATIVASVISKKSVPAVHSAAALMKILSMPYYGTHSIVIRAILNKKYALPYRVIDAVVDHFMSFLDETRGPMPVIWHQCLLIFAQRYKTDVTAEQKQRLKLLFKRQHHHQITYEVRRELFSSVSRGEVKKKKGGSSDRMEI